MSRISLCITCDNNYAKYAGVTIASILSNALESDSYKFYIVSDSITDEYKDVIKQLSKIKNFEIEFVYPEKDLFSEYTNTKTTDYLPLASFYRLKLATLIPNEDKIIYLDCDTVVNTSLSSLFNINIDNYFCAGIKDVGYKRLGKRLGLTQEQTYINSGVLLINLKKWREDNAELKLSDFAKEHPEKLSLGDQDLINICFANEILLLDGKWNVQVVNFCSRSDYSNDFKILHYMGGSKPWKMGSYIPLKKYYFKYLKMTQWESPDIIWHLKSNILGALLYFKHRPLFMFRPGFFKSLFYLLIRK